MEGQQVRGTREANFPLFLRMKHILDMYENVTGRKERVGGRILFKSKGSNKEVATHSICLFLRHFGRVRIWKQKDLSAFPKKFLVQAVSVLIMSLLRHGELTRNTFCIAQVLLQRKVSSNQYKGFWKKNQVSI